MQGKTQWHLITMYPQGGSTGDNLLKIITLIKQSMAFKFVILGDINGAPKKQGETIVFQLHKRENEVLPLEKVLQVLPEVGRFDWGDFYLFEKEPLEWIRDHQLTYPEIISQSDTTVRAIDDTYIYVYTPHESIVQVLQACQGLESITTDKLENLSFPV
ncbi:MAG: hypothetical protein ACSNEK_10340 [Parachlamydiaceae bacterium]